MKIVVDFGIVVALFLLSYGPLALLAWLAGYDIFSMHRGWLLAMYVCICTLLFVKGLMEVFDPLQYKK